jgi:hypothetical protein
MFLVRLFAVRTGLAPPDAERRVDTAIANAKDKLREREEARSSLHSWPVPPALLGATAAWFAAGAGERHRDENAPRWISRDLRVVLWR